MSSSLLHKRQSSWVPLSCTEVRGVPSFEALKSFRCKTQFPPSDPGLCLKFSWNIFRSRVVDKKVVDFFLIDWINVGFMSLFSRTDVITFELPMILGWSIKLVAETLAFWWTTITMWLSTNFSTGTCEVGGEPSTTPSPTHLGTEICSSRFRTTEPYESTASSGNQRAKCRKRSNCTTAIYHLSIKNFPDISFNFIFASANLKISRCFLRVSQQVIPSEVFPT